VRQRRGTGKVGGRIEIFESVALTTIVVAIAAGGAGLALVLAVLWLVRGAGRGASDERLAELVADMNTRMEAMVSDLSEALESAQEEGRRNRMLGELAGTIDLDEVLTRTLDTAGAMPGVDAALARLENEGSDAPIVATLGLSRKPSGRQSPGRRATQRLARSRSSTNTRPR
jgi:hypothetical protein